MKIRLMVLVAGVVALAGCAFTSPNGTHVVFNPGHAPSVLCIDQNGCYAPNGGWYPYHANIPTSPQEPPPPAKSRLASGVIWRTDGTADGAAECHFQRISNDGTQVLLDVHSDHGARYVQTAASDSEFVTTGCQPWHQYDGSEQVGGSVAIPCGGNGCIFFPRRNFADGDYIVGHEIFGPAPEDVIGDINHGMILLNNVNGPEACQWQKMTNGWGSEASEGGNGNSVALVPGHPFQPHALILNEGDNLRLTDCGGVFWAGG